MNHWVMAFVGDHAKGNLEATRRTDAFCVSSSRTPARRARPGDPVLFYLAGEGFVARAEISSPAQPPRPSTGWSSKKPPLFEISVEDIRPFARPILYKFPGDGHHPVLGFHRYGLTGGFLAILESGFDDVLGWADLEVSNPTPEEAGDEAQVAPPPVEAAPCAPRPLAPEGRAPIPAAPDVARREREKRGAGQHALHEGRKRVALWTVAEMGASVFGMKGVSRFARGKARTAEKTWLSGGRAEEKVGAELEALRAHGFYVFHDVPLPGAGNVDHVALGERGFFAIETKSHSGRVSWQGGQLLRDGRPFERDFIKQAWKGCYRLREAVGVDDVAPLLLFTEAFVEGCIKARGVRVLPLRWCVGEILASRPRHERRAVHAAVARLSSATGCHPSAAPRPS